MSFSNQRHLDVMTGLFFVTGVLSFILGQFVLSTMLFGTATLSSLVNIATPVRL